MAWACEKLGPSSDWLEDSLCGDASGEDGVLLDGESGSSAPSRASACKTTHDKVVYISAGRTCTSVLWEVILL